MLGPDQPVDLRLIEIPSALKALEGVVMELADCAFPLVTSMIPTTDLDEGFRGINWALLVGSIPRKQGMERKALTKTEQNRNWRPKPAPTFPRSPIWRFGATIPRPNIPTFTMPKLTQASRS